MLSGLFIAALLLQTPPPADTESMDIAELDLGDLLDTQIESVSRRQERASEAPAVVFVVNREDILRQGFRTLDEVLRSVPGLFTVDDSLYPVVGFRGLQPLGDLTTRVLVMIDGHPVNNSVGIGQSNIGRDLPVDVGMIERVEVIKGPAGSVYGPNAYFGVINLVTRSAKENDGEVFAAGEYAQQDVRAGEAGLHYGRTMGDVGITLGLNAYRSRGFDYDFPILEQHDDREAPPGGRVTGNDARASQSAYATVRYKDFVLNGGYAQRNKQLPTAPYSVLIGDTRSRFSNEALFAQLAFERQLFDPVKVYARLSYDSFSYVDDLAYPGPPDDAGLFKDVAHDKWVSAEARVTLTPFEGHRDIVGVWFERHDTLQHSFYSALPSAEEDPEAGFGVGPIPVSFDTLNAYAMVEQRFADKAAFQGGLTFYSHSLFGSRFTPKLSAVVTPTKDDTVKAIYSEGFRPPNMFEAYFEDGLDFTDNPSLRPETVRSLEVAYERRLGTVLTLGGTVFGNSYERLIVSTTVAAEGAEEPAPGEEAEVRLQFQNVGSIRHYGGELYANASWAPYLRAWGGVSVQDADFGEQQTGEPNFARVTGTLSVSTCALHPSLSLGANAAYVARRLKDLENVTTPGDRATVDPYLLLNASARWEVPQTKGLVLQLTVFNILDSVSYDPVVGDHAPVTQIARSPRELRLRLEHRF